MKRALTAEAVVADPSFPAVCDRVIAATGHVFYASRPHAVAQHIAARLGARNVACCGEYLGFLNNTESGAAELDEIVALVTIGETYFFRHREMFDALRDVVLPRIMERNSESRRLRIWSAGCSNGAEAYSLAIVLRRDMAGLVAGWDISILGTDINRTFLDQAARGHYEE